MTTPVPAVSVDAPNVQIWALPRTGSPVFLRDLGDYQLSRVRGEIGSVSIDYPLDGLGFDVLAEVAKPSVELEVEIRTDGSDASARRALLMSGKGDRAVPGATWTFTGAWLAILIQAAITVYESSHEKGETAFHDMSAGAVVRALVQRAQARGLLPGITMSFSATLDSRGVAWAADKKLSVSWAPGRSYLDILQELDEDLGVAEWDLDDNRVLHLYGHGTKGVDRTLPPAQVTLEWGRDIVDAPATQDNAGGGTRVLAAGKDGLYTSATNSTAESVRGRPIETFRSWNNVTDPGTLDTLAQAEASVIGNGDHEYSHELTLAAGGPRPGRDFDTHDWVLRAVNGTTERLQVAQWVLKRNGGNVTATVALGDLIDAHEVKTRRLLRKLTSGSSAVGTSAAEPDVDDGKAPAAPGTIIANSDTYQVQGQSLALVQAEWPDVTTNDDGTPASDVASYAVQWREKSPGDAYPWYAAGEPEVSFLSFGGLRTNLTIQLRVAARDKYNRNSEWSPITEITTQADNEPPPKPAPLIATVDLGRVQLANPETAADQSPMPLDYSVWRLWTSLAATPNLATDTLVNEHQRGTKRSQWTPAGAQDYGITRYFYLTALDRDGNESVPSDPVEATPTAIGFADLPYKDSGNLAEDGSFEDPSGRTVTEGRSSTAWALVQGIAGDLADHGVYYARGTATIGAGTERVLLMSGPVPVRTGQQFLMRLAVRRNAAANGSLRIGLVWTYRDGSTSPSILDVPATGITTPGVWVQRDVAPHIAPANAVSFEVRVVMLGSVTAGQWDVDRVEVRELIGTALIQDAAITNAKVVNLDVAKLTSGELSAVIALLGEIRTANAPNARVTINDTGLRKYDGSNVLRLEITESTTYIDGRIVTGRPGESRIEMGNQSFGRDNLIAYDQANKAIVVIGQVYDEGTGQPSASGLLIQDPTGRDMFWVYGSGNGANDMQFRGGAVFLECNNPSNTSQTRGGYLRLERNGTADTFFGRVTSGGIDSRHMINSSGTHTFDIGTSRIAEVNTNGVVATRLRGYGGRAFLEADAGGDVSFGYQNGQLAVYSGAGNFFIKNFVIDHPDDPARLLVHGCTESPHAGVEYWGEVDVVDYEAVVELPSYFESLTRTDGRQVQVTVMLPDEWDEPPATPAPAGPVEGGAWPPPLMPRIPEPVPAVAASRPRDGRFRIRCSMPNARVAWLVKAIRKDVPPLEAEPLRSDVQVHGAGPYTYITPRASVPRVA